MLSQVEPAAVAEGARIVIAALVALGWVTIDPTAVNTILSVVGGVVSIVLTVWTRRRVAPTSMQRPSA